MKTGYVVADAMSTKPVTCSRDVSLQACAQLMRASDVGSVLVVEGDSLVGIATEKDFLYKAVADGLDVEKRCVGDIMSTDIVSIAPHVDIFEALKVLNKHGFTHLPVKEGERLVGFLTLQTILKIEPQLIDLIAERFELRGISPQSSLLESFDAELEGRCESCGNYSSQLIDDAQGRVCPSCLIKG